MISVVALYFARDFQTEIEPFQLLLGASIGIITVVILVKKIISRRNKK
jgi:hypothetical protein